MFFLLSSFVTAVPATKLEVVNVYKATDGLPGNSVRALLEDSKGNIWIGTRDGGAARLDGEKWAYFSEENGLLSNGVIAIAEDSLGRIWLAGGGGASSVDKEGKLTSYSIVDDMGLNGRAVFSIDQHDTDIYFGTTGGIGILSGDLWSRMYEGQVVHDVAFKDGQIWISTRRGGVTRIVHHFAFNFLKEQQCRNLFKGSNGNVWVGTSNGGAWRLKDDSVEVFRAEATMLPAFEDKDGGIWFATEGDGLFRFDGKEWIRYSAEDGLPSDVTYTAIQDSKGFIWIATEEGLAKARIKNVS